jgi:hypothetical protein
VRELRGQDEQYSIGLKMKNVLSLYSNNIGSAGRAPGEDGNIGFNTGVEIDFIIGGKHQIINSTFHSHREGFTTKWKKATPMILGTDTAKQGSC